VLRGVAVAEQDDGLDAYEPLIMRGMAKGNRRISNPGWSRLYKILLPFALIAPVSSAVTSNTNRGLNIFLAISFAWSSFIVWFKQRQPASPSPRPPAYMTWTAQRWWIGSALVGALATLVIAAVAYAHRPLDQGIVLIVGMTLCTGAMWLVRVIAKRRYAG
jgi:asparagine N-glycosylation enzyme membrane subunit Stt3